MLAQSTTYERSATAYTPFCAACNRLWFGDDGSSPASRPDSRLALLHLRALGVADLAGSLDWPDGPLEESDQVGEERFHRFRWASDRATISDRPMRRSR